MITLTLRPTSDVLTQLQRSTGATNYGCVDETGAGNGLVDYIWTNPWSGLVWYRDLYGLTDHTTETETILAVRVYARHQGVTYAGVAVNASGRTVLKTHDVEYNGETKTLITSWDLTYTEYTVNPQTGAAWTWDEIDDLQAGWAGLPTLLIHPYGYQYNIFAYCTQVYVEVDYDAVKDATVTVPALSIDATPVAPSMPIYASYIKIPALSIAIDTPKPKIKTISNYSPLPPFKVITQNLSSAPQNLTCTMSLMGIPNLLAEDKASKDYSHSYADSKTVKDLITEIASGQPVRGETGETQEEYNATEYLNDATYAYGQILPLMTEVRTLTKIAFRLSKVGNPTGDITFRVDDSDFSGILASKVLGDASMLTSISSWYEVTLDTPLVLSEGLNYCIYCEFSTGDADNKVGVKKESGSVKANEYAVLLPVVGDPETQTTVDCAYKYWYQNDGIDCFDHCEAYEVVFDSEDALIDSYQPRDAFSISEGESRLSAINKLLQYTTCVKRVEDDGKIHISNPSNISGYISKQIIVATDDGYVRSDTAEFNNTPGIQFVGHAVSGAVRQYHAFYRFSGITIPKGAKIASCYLQLHEGNSQGSPKTKIYLEKANNPTAVTSYADYISRTLTTAGVDWDITEIPPDGIRESLRWYTSPSLVSILQELVNEYELDNQAIQILHKDDGSSALNYLLVDGYYDYPPRLYIEGGYDYEYSLTESYHNFFSKSLRKSLVIPNKIVVHSLTEDINQYSGSATDAESYALLPISHFVKTKLNSNDQAEDIAEAMIARLQTESQKGAAIVPINVGAEVYDFVKVTDAIEGDSRTGNIGYLRRSYKPGPSMQSSWKMSFGFGRLPVKAFVGTRPHLLADRSIQPEPSEGMGDDSYVRWSMIRKLLTESIPDAFARVWDGDEQEGYAGINDLITALNEINQNIKDLTAAHNSLVDKYNELIS